jgi:hypothetical protein
VLSLYAKGLTTGEISAHFAEIYGASVSKETISRITDKVLEEMTTWIRFGQAAESAASGAASGAPAQPVCRECRSASLASLC